MLLSQIMGRIVLLVRKLLSHYLNVRDHNPPTLQTDGRTDRRHTIAIPRST